MTPQDQGGGSGESPARAPDRDRPGGTPSWEHLGRHTAELAHELRNALHAILTFSELLESTEALDETRRLAAKIRSNARLCKAVVDDVLAFGEDQRPRMAPSDLVAVLRRAVEALPPAPDGIIVELVLPDELPPVATREHRLQQLILNLVLNAQNAMSQAERTGSIVISAEWAELDSRTVVRVAVDDPGPGVPPALRESVFQPFQRAHDGAGIGLGLAVARRIAHEHAGTLELESSSRGGARFVLTLPATTDTVVEDEKAGPAATGAALRVLVIDDDETTLETYRMILGLDGHEVVCNRLGESGLEQLRERDFDIVLVDIKLPDLSGPDLFDRIKAECGQAAPNVIFATGDLLNEETQRFLNSTGNPYLIKPFEIDDLRAAINVVTGR